MKFNRGAYRIALGVVCLAMGVAIIPSVGILGFFQVIVGGALVYLGVLTLDKEKKEL